MKPRVAYLPGDGIGPEVLAAARTVIEAAGLDVEWVEGRVGWDAWSTEGDALPPATRDLLDATEGCLFGAITSRPAKEAEAALPADLRGTGRTYRSPILRIRQEKGLHLNVRPNRFWSGVPSPLADAPNGTSITIFRENTEDLYVGVEAYPVPRALSDQYAQLFASYGRFSQTAPEDLAVSTRVITRAATERLLQAAFEHAAAHGHGTVVLAEKANVLRATGGLVLEVAEEVAKAYPHIRLEIANVDALAADVIVRPHRYPVIAATNLFGDILSDIAAAATGGLGLAPSANLGDDYALFEPVHGSAPDIAGTGRANPIAAVLSAGLLAAHLGFPQIRDQIEAAVAHVLATGEVQTPDLGGTATTDDMTAALIDALPERVARIPTQPQ